MVSEDVTSSDVVSFLRGKFAVLLKVFESRRFCCKS